MSTARDPSSPVCAILELVEFGGWWAGQVDRAESCCFLLALASGKVGDNASETQASSGLSGKAKGRTQAGGSGKLCGLAALPDSCHLHLPPVLLLS